MEEQIGDYIGEIKCGICEWSLSYILIDQYKSRFPEDFYRKFVEDLDIKKIEEKQIQECYHEDIHERLTKKKGGGGSGGDHNNPVFSQEVFKNNKFMHRKRNPKKYNEWTKDGGNKK